jgi:hypothetical protein
MSSRSSPIGFAPLCLECLQGWVRSAVIFSSDVVKDTSPAGDKGSSVIWLPHIH